MIKKDIFEVLRDKIHCEYVSDLLFVDYERIRIHLEYMDQNDFELKEILDAISWFGGTVPEEATKDNAWNALLELKRKIIDGYSEG